MTQPLADFLRPQKLEEVLGQSHLIGENGLISQMLKNKSVSSMIFWGGPATGKTTLARIIGKLIDADVYSLSAVMDGKAELKKIIISSQNNLLFKKPTLLFIDEIHRWNKAQQDALLPYVENGQIILIGATTENPSFSINSALLSRLQVISFNNLTPDDILKSLEKGLQFLSHKKTIKSEYTGLLKEIVKISNYDIRYALIVLESSWNISGGNLTMGVIKKAAQKNLVYDEGGEEHFNLISAVHKSIRSSNPTAGVYWVVRMLESGADPLYVARRLLRFASEDIGNANPNALLLANQVYETVKKLGLPECNTSIVQLTEYLANSKKNNSAYVAYKMAKKDIEKYGSLPVPMNIRNAPTKLMKEMGYGKGYEYDHDLKSKKSDQNLLPPELKGVDYF